MCARSEVLGFTALGVTFRGGTQCIQSSIQLPTTQQREFKFNSNKKKENKPCLCGGWQQTDVHLPQTTIGLLIGGEGAVADVAKGVAGLEFAFLAL